MSPEFSTDRGTTPYLALKRSPSIEFTIDIASLLDEKEFFAGIRCPLCEWRPDDSCLWCCAREGTPEPPFPACGAVWNTFRTHGRCPGCSHQWTWTSCLRCSGWSLHEDWYEDEEPRP
jgi:hypothetical protein